MFNRKIDKRSYTINFTTYKTFIAKQSKETFNIDFHQLDPLELSKRFNTCLKKGLSLASIEIRRKRYGKNSITLSKTSFLVKLYRYTIGGFFKQLWICFVLAVVSYEPLGTLNGAKPDSSNLGLAGIILFLIVSQSVINFNHDYIASLSEAEFFKRLPQQSLVIRDGTKRWVDNQDLVVGDVIFLRAGNRVPADVRLFHSEQMKLDNSNLTGEDWPVNCNSEPSKSSFLNSSNMAFMESYATHGNGCGVVVAIGDKTIIGTINKFKVAPLTKIKLSIELERFMYFISLLSFLYGVFVILVWGFWLRIQFPTFMSVSSAVTNATSVMVAFIPEGISFGLTITLAVMAYSMSKRNVLVKDLEAFENISAMDVLLSDKTGTLTVKALRVATIQLDRDYEPDNCKPMLDQNHIPLSQLIVISSLCNSATVETIFDNENKSKKDFQGDSTDIAFLKFSEKYIPRGYLMVKYKHIRTTPFRSERRWMATLLKPSTENPFSTQDKLIIVKGAPETLLPLCKFMETGSGIVPFTRDRYKEIENNVDRLAILGQRVLVLAFTTVKSTDRWDSNIESDDLSMITSTLTFVGTVGLFDTPRPDAHITVKACRTAGIKVCMMTGDHPINSASIARKVGILTTDKYHNKDQFLSSFLDQIIIKDDDSPSALVIQGNELDNLTTEQWEYLTSYQEIVFARMNSSHKLKTLQNFQDREHVVGCLGDGVNDVVALRNADVGISVGLHNEFALNASGIVLIDESLSQLLTVINKGRRLFDNTYRLMYVIPAGSLSETMPIFMNLLFGLPQPLSGLLMTTISVITDLLPSVAVMAKNGSDSLMRDKPRDLKKQPLVRKMPLFVAFLWIGIPDSFLGHISYFLTMYLEAGIRPDQLFLLYDKWTDGYLGKTQSELYQIQYTAQSVYFLTMAILQIVRNLMETHFNKASFLDRLFTIKHSPNFWYLTTVVGTVLVILILFYIPALNNLFNTKPLGFYYWALSTGISLVGLLFFEFFNIFTLKGVKKFCKWFKSKI